MSEPILRIGASDRRRLRLSATLNAALRLAQSRQGVDDTLARILREQAFINC